MTLLNRLHNWLLGRHETRHASLTAETIREAWLDGLRVGSPVAVVSTRSSGPWDLLDVATITRDAGDYWAVQCHNGERLFRKDDGTNSVIPEDRLAPKGSR